MTETIRFFVNGRPFEAERGTMLLSALRGAGATVPTLCHHPSVEPSGACRLCVVEITHPDWKGWSGLVTSCLYPVEKAGLEVRTHSPRVRAVRRTVLEMLLARCPEAEAVRRLAREEGVEETPFPVPEGADKCVLCGLCVRACEELGPAALAALDRGAEKVVGPRPDGYGEACTGCGVCAYVCPTGAIEDRLEQGTYHIWNREFPVSVCRVEPEACRACGVCEEVCPIALPRVAFFRAGSVTSRIDVERCTGCGICAGACPAGAIVQKDSPLEDPAAAAPASGTGGRGAVAVFACSRSPLPAGGMAGASVTRVSCIGRVPLEAILERLARGAKGVLLLCRDQDTCPHGRGGALGEARAATAEALAAAAGLGTGRVAYRRPAAGPEGPAEAVEALRSGCPASPLSAYYTGEGAPPAGLDRALHVLAWFRAQPELTPALPAETAERLAALPEGDDALLYLGELPDLDLLLAGLVREWRLASLFEDAARVLVEKGIAVRPALSARAVRESPVKKVVVFSREGLPDFGREKEIVTLDAIAGAEAAGPAPPAGAPFPFRFRITQSERRALLDRIAAAASDGWCASPGEAAQAALLLREGAWRPAAAAVPGMAFSRAVRASSKDAPALGKRRGPTP